jgi:DNA-directed RNA polymerase subunit K/omega
MSDDESDYAEPSEDEPRDASVESADDGEPIDEIPDDQDDMEVPVESGEETTDESGDDDTVAGETLYDVKQVSQNNKEIVIVPDDERITPHVMSKYEMTRVVSIRATQISEHNNPMVDVSGLTDPIKMAKRELMERMCPLTLRRIIGDRKNPKTGEMETYMELWNPNTMVFAEEYVDV